MTDPRTDEDRIRGIVMAANMDPIPIAENYPFGVSEQGQVTNISSGSDEIITFTPPTDKIWTVKGLVFQTLVDLDATSGYIEAQIYIKNNMYGLQAQANYDMVDGEVGFMHGELRGDKLQAPADGGAQTELALSFYATSSTPLTMRFINQQDVVHEKNRQYRLLYQELPLKT